MKEIVKMFWDDETFPDPSPNKILKNPQNLTESHVRHYCNFTYEDFYQLMLHKHKQEFQTLGKCE